MSGMLGKFFGGGSPTASAALAGEEGVLPPATLLVIQGDDYDWPLMLKGAKLSDGRAIRVVQTGWTDIEVHSCTFSKQRINVEVQRQAKTASVPQELQNRHITVHPDFVLVRNEVRAPNFDGRCQLNGFLFADTPSVNSLESILLMCERPVMQGFLQRMKRRLGEDVFPVVDQHFSATHKSIAFYGYTFPAVVKIGSAHAGAGKMKIVDHRQMSDFRSVLQMMPDEHCMAEPFITGSGDLRIQKIGAHYRAFRRVGMSGEWKTNTGSSIMDVIDVEPRYKLWADEAAAMFGGLDILTVDAIIEETTGKEYILEVNGTSSGLHPDFAEEDNQHIKELVLERMNAAICGQPLRPSQNYP